MYQVMIVDDEEPVLDSFAFILSKDVTDFALCGKARSGPEAISKIQELIPDLVFMDIQIPGIDGIETISQIRNKYPNIVFILATAYERFDIARKAIPLGVFSYMVKPISRKALLEVLEKVKNHLDGLRERDLRRLEDVELLQKTRDERKNSFLSSLIWGNPDEKEWGKISRLFSLNSERGLLSLIEAVGDIPEGNKIKLYGSVTEKIQYKYKCLGTVVNGRLLMFIPEEQKLDNLDCNLKSILNEYNQYNFITGQGGIYHFSALHTSFSEAFKPFTAAAKREKSYSAEQERVKMICRSILDPDSTDAHHLFEDYWSEIFNSMSFPVAQGKMIALFTLLLSKFDSRLLSVSNFTIDPAEEIMGLKSIAEWIEWSSGNINRLREVSRINQNQLCPRPLSAAMSYIRENYKKPLQLSLVAEECGITGSYLSRLFKEHLGITFIDYLNRFRLNKAIILLEEKKYSIKEISYLVGYQDPNYFSRIFRRHMGISPSDLLDNEDGKNDL